MSRFKDCFVLSRESCFFLKEFVFLIICLIVSICLVFMLVPVFLSFSSLTLTNIKNKQEINTVNCVNCHCEMFDAGVKQNLSSVKNSNNGE